MKISFSRVLPFSAICLFSLSGCYQGRAGGPGANGPTSPKPAYEIVDQTFNLSVPLLATSIKQGEKKSVSIGIKRGKNFDEEVAIMFPQLPKGVKFDPTVPVIKHGDTQVLVMMSCDKTSSLGDFTLTVTGHPTKGADAMVDFKIRVDKP